MILVHLLLCSFSQLCTTRLLLLEGNLTELPSRYSNKLQYPEDANFNVPGDVREKLIAKPWGRWESRDRNLAASIACRTLLLSMRKVEAFTFHKRISDFKGLNSDDSRYCVGHHKWWNFL